MEMETIKEDQHWKPEQKNIIKWKTLTPYTHKSFLFNTERNLEMKRWRDNFNSDPLDVLSWKILFLKMFFHGKV